jgi:DNA primase
MTVLQSFLPDGLDPAGLREAQGDSALQAVCDAAEDVVLGSLRVLGEMRELSEEIAAVRSLLQLVRSVPDGARRLAYARRVASGLGLPPESLLELALR